MGDAQEVFETEWDPFPEPKLRFETSQDRVECVLIDLDSNVQRAAYSGAASSSIDVVVQG